MRYDFYAGDVEPAIGTPLGGGGVLPDGAIVQFVMAQADGVKRVVGAAVIDSPGTSYSDPQVHYQWQPGDTDAPGVYRAVWRVLYSGISPETFPSDETLYIVIHPRL